MFTVVLNTASQMMRPPIIDPSNPIQAAADQYRNSVAAAATTEVVEVDAASIQIDVQTLTLLDEKGAVVAIFAPGSWKYAYPTEKTETETTTAAEEA